MSVGKEIKFGFDARRRMLNGITKTANAVVCTLGPKGRTVLIDDGKVYPVITKDGATVIKGIFFSDRYENAGAQIIKEAAQKSNALCGDGSTTVTLLAAELAKAGVRLVEIGNDPVDIQRGYDAATEKLQAELDKMTRKVESEDDIINIATISGNNDEVVGKTVYEAFSRIGEGGVVNVQDSHTKMGKTTIEFNDGMSYPKGLTKGLFVTNHNTDTYESDNPYILLMNYNATKDEIMPICNFAMTKKLPFVVISPHVTDDVSTLLTMMAQQNVPVAVATSDGYSEDSLLENLKDLAALLGTSVVTSKEELTKMCPKTEDGKYDMSKLQFGKCKHISIGLHKTEITGGNSSKEDIQKRVDEIDAEILKGDQDANRGMSEEERSLLVERKARLTGGIATIKVGALSETRLVELKARYEDAVNAVKAAITDGIVCGGGTALLRAAYNVRQTLAQDAAFKSKSDSFQAGLITMLDICRIPAKVIISSVNTKDFAYILSSVEHSNNPLCGYDAKKEKMSDNMFLDGIIDPVKVEKSALAFASDVAGTFITTECVITDEAKNVSLEPYDEVAANDPDYNEENY